jgi:hypothetical protein
VTGTAVSSNFPVTKGAFQTKNKAADNLGSNAFVTKLNFDGTALHYSTFLGGNGGISGIGDSGFSIAVDGLGHAYLTGFTQSSNFPVTKDAFQDTNKAPDTADDTGSNAFVTELNFDGTGLQYSTYLGGSISDVGAGITLDGRGDVYLTGYANSTYFPVTKGAYQTVNNAAVNATANAFITKFIFSR